jgi:hypothetical protein
MDRQTPAAGVPVDVAAAARLVRGGCPAPEPFDVAVTNRRLARIGRPVETDEQER